MSLLGYTSVGSLRQDFKLIISVPTSVDFKLS